MSKLLTFEDFIIIMMVINIFGNIFCVSLLLISGKSEESDDVSGKAVKKNIHN